MRSGMIGFLGAPKSRLWTPLDLSAPPSIFLSDGSTITDVGGFASSVSDQSGNSFDFSQSTSANRPQIVTGAGGKVALLYDGSNDSISCNVAGARSVFSGVSSGWVMLVTAKTAIDASPTNRDAFRINTGSGAPARLVCQIGTADASSGQSRLLMGARRLDSDGFGYITTPVGTLTDTAPHIIEFRQDWSTGQGAIYIDGESVAGGATTSSGATSGTVSAYPVTIAGDPIGGRHYNGTNSAVIVGNVMPSADEWEKLRGWAAWNFGLVGNLSAMHPYKYSPPMT